MQAIVKLHYPNLKERLLDEAMTLFFELRAVEGLRKKPSTSGAAGLDPAAVGGRHRPEALRTREPGKLVPLSTVPCSRRAGLASVLRSSPSWRAAAAECSSTFPSPAPPQAFPCSLRELLDLYGALAARLASLDMDEFYQLSRCLLVKDEAHYDRFDRAFAEYYEGWPPSPVAGEPA